MMRHIISVKRADLCLVSVLALIFLAAVAAAQFGIDTTPPQTTYALTPAAPNGQNGWYKTNVTVNLTCTDNLAGCDYTNYSIDSPTIPPTTWTQVFLGGALTNWTAFNLTADGNHSLDYNVSEDVAGNVGTRARIWVAVDQIAPNITIISPVTKIYNHSENASGIWLNYTVNESILNNVVACWYSLNGGLTNFSLPKVGANCQNVTFNVTAEGAALNVIVWANDTAGNVGSAARTFAVDVTAPVAPAISHEPDVVESSQKINFNVTCVDNIAGCKQITVTTAFGTCTIQGSSLLPPVTEGTNYSGYENCSIITPDCTYEKYDYNVTLDDNVFHTRTIEVGDFEVKKSSGCSCSLIKECFGGYCAAGTCITAEPPGVIILIPDPVRIELGTIATIPVKIKNNLPISDTLVVTVTADNKKIEYWTWIGNRRRDPEPRTDSIDLNGGQERTVVISIFGGEVITQMAHINITATSALTGLSASDGRGVIINYPGAGDILARAPEFDFIGFAGVILGALLILFRLRRL